MTPTPPDVSRRSALAAGGALALTAAGTRLAGPASALTDLMAPSAQVAAARSPLPLSLAHVGSSTQVVVVQTSSWKDIHGTIEAWELVKGVWVQRMTPHHANVGSRGWIYGADRIQGDHKTPAGTYRIHKSFGYAKDPGTHIPYNHLDPGDYWAGDQRDPKTYNVFQSKHPKKAKWRKSESEALYYTRPAYRYAACIDFNLATGIHKLKDGQWVSRHHANTKLGSAIFLHCYGTTGVQGYTLGCVATRKDRMKWLLKWFKPGAHPRIVMGPSSVITQV